MKITLVGTGLMGSAIARRLLAEGHEVTVWNRTRAKAQALTEHGAKVAKTPALAVASGEVILLVLQDGDAIASVMLTAPVLEQVGGRTIVQMGTISPEESVQLSAEFSGSGADYLEAPMLGSTPEAGAGALLLMVAGPKPVFERQRGLFASLGEDPVYVGAVGKAASLKLALNQLLVGLVATFSMSVGMVLQSDVPVDAFMDIVHASALRCPQFDKKLPRMLDRDFSDPHFPVSHMLKDVNLILGEARRHGLEPDVQEGVKKVVQRALDLGYVDVDYSALYNGINPPN